MKAPEKMKYIDDENYDDENYDEDDYNNEDYDDLKQGEKNIPPELLSREKDYNEKID